jgi:hypothetical protein
MLQSGQIRWQNCCRMRLHIVEKLRTLFVRPNDECCVRRAIIPTPKIHHCFNQYGHLAKYKHSNELCS